jgi:hypothetical protein
MSDDASKAIAGFVTKNTPQGVQDVASKTVAGAKDLANSAKEATLPLREAVADTLDPVLSAARQRAGEFQRSYAEQVGNLPRTGVTYKDGFNAVSEELPMVGAALGDAIKFNPRQFDWRSPAAKKGRKRDVNYTGWSPPA